MKSSSADPRSATARCRAARPLIEATWLRPISSVDDGRVGLDRHRLAACRTAAHGRTLVR